MDTNDDGSLTSKCHRPQRGGSGSKRVDPKAVKTDS